MTDEPTTAAGRAPMRLRLARALHEAANVGEYNLSQRMMSVHGGPTDSSYLDAADMILNTEAFQRFAIEAEARQQDDSALRAALERLTEHHAEAECYQYPDCENETSAAKVALAALPSSAPPGLTHPYRFTDPPTKGEGTDWHYCDFDSPHHAEARQQDDSALRLLRELRDAGQRYYVSIARAPANYSEQEAKDSLTAFLAVQKTVDAALVALPPSTPPAEPTPEQLAEGMLRLRSRDDPPSTPPALNVDALARAFGMRCICPLSMDHPERAEIWAEVDSEYARLLEQDR